MMSGPIESAEAARALSGARRATVAAAIGTTPVVVGAVRFPPLDELRSMVLLSELWPGTTNDGVRFRLFASLWQTWLRLRGLGHRISDPRSAPTGEPGSPPGETL